MLGATGYNDFTFSLVGKANRIANQVPPRTGSRTDQDRIITTFLNLVNFQRLMVFLQISLQVKIFIVERHEFKEEVLTGHEAHTAFILAVLVCNCLLYTSDA